jgi:hypothetical protein
MIWRWAFPVTAPGHTGASPRGRDSEADANLRQIAAAPDMLDLLQNPIDE